MQELITSQLANIPSPTPTLIIVVAVILIIIGLKLFFLRKLIGTILSVVLSISLTAIGGKLVGLANSEDAITKNYNVEYTGNSLKLTKKNSGFLLKDNLEFKVTHENDKVKIESGDFSTTIDESEFLKYIGAN